MKDIKKQKIDSLIQQIIDNPDDNYTPHYEIWYECGCQASFEESIKKERQTYVYSRLRNLICCSCPNHPEISKKNKIVFYCRVCGAEVTKTATGAPLSQCIITRQFCNYCGKRANALRNKKYRTELKELKEIKGKDGIVQSSRKHLKIDYMKHPRQFDCKYYDDCISKAGIENTDLDCRGCERYEFKALDVNNYVSYHGGMDKAKVNKYVDAVYVAKLTTTIEKMLRKKAGKAKFNRLFQSRHKTHEQFILEAEERSKRLRAESRGKGKAKAK